MLDKVEKVVKLKKELDKVNDQLKVVEESIQAESIIAIRLVFAKTTSVDLNADSKGILRMATQLAEDLKRREIEIRAELETLVTAPPKTKKWKK